MTCHPRRRPMGSGLSLVAATAATLLFQAAARADVAPIEPASLARGPEPQVAYVVHDVIRDGDLRIPVSRKGKHDALWEVTGGYVLRDVNVAPGSRTRLTFVSDTGERREIARSRELMTVTISADGRRIAYQRTVSRTGELTVVTVEDPRTGRILARQRFRLAVVVALDAGRVLLGMRTNWRDPASVWWHYRTGRIQRWYDQAAVRADVPHGRVVFDWPGGGEFCTRVAALSHPRHTLWRSCRMMPHQWSPDGARALATHAYFDARGTTRWWVIGGSSPARELTIAGRLDWHAVWEDDDHFLTLAQGDDGLAAIVRCDLSGSCERASRTWTMPLDPDLYYTSPPVTLAEE
ncbi:hypothetical protein ISU07_16015 [Nocardioides islandensis]|uniref:WD40 repeat domain-containing protein n=1 Tax=Nocardioides islandensis TaxID=433663 RepID=A0A930YF81_9ACTN|nr:hypothetical protein [Nocardioides islandensis]MBF4764637.1 hypothetical protein [Nocardioides islandensis]